MSNDVIDKFSPVLGEGNIYVISNANIERSVSFGFIKHDYCLTIEDCTLIEQVNDTNDLKSWLEDPKKPIYP